VPKFFWIDTRADFDKPKGWDIADLIDDGDVETEEDLYRFMKARMREGLPVVSDLADPSKPPRAKPEPTPAAAAPAVEVEGNTVRAIRPNIERQDDGEFELVPPEYSEATLTRKLIKHLDGKFRYAVDEDRGYLWDGSLWTPDSDKQIRLKSEAQRVAEPIAADCALRGDLGAKAIGIADRIASVRTWSNMAAGACLDQGVWCSRGEFDADPWVLNTPAGAYDLRTGEPIADVKSQLCTKRTRVAPEGECPRWLQFLDECTAKDPELIDYLHRVAGYVLTGSIREQKFFFAYGSGGNGKGTYINTLAAAMGTYASGGEAKSFMSSARGGSHSEEVARMAGSRLVTVPELQSGERWNEALVKALTGGDRVTARAIYGKQFEYDPTFKLFFHGNHKPHLRDVDPAIRRRLYLIPFEVELEEERQDKGLQGYLIERELGGVLRWAMGGTQAWIDRGLTPPERVRAATDKYLSEEDRINTFIVERLELGPNYREGKREIYAAFREWCQDNGEHYIDNQKTFTQRMRDRGMVEGRDGSGRYWVGVRRRPASEH
jgi:putative DNA primase/helicase